MNNPYFLANDFIHVLVVMYYNFVVIKNYQFYLFIVDNEFKH